MSEKCNICGVLGDAVPSGWYQIRVDAVIVNCCSPLCLGAFAYREDVRCLQELVEEAGGP